MKKEIDTPQNIFSTTDIGLCAFIELSGHPYTSLSVDDQGKVEFTFSTDVSRLIEDYYSSNTKVDPLRYKSELDKTKKLIFGYLRSQENKTELKDFQ